MTASAPPVAIVAPRERARTGGRRSNRAVHVFLIAMAVLWLFPLLWAVYQSFRPYGETAAAPVALPQTLTLENYVNAWNQAELPYYYLNTLIVAIPAVILTLLIASMVAFALTRFRFRFNLPLLMLFTAGNLLP
ncbi:MAG TPA: hypothetical protein VFI28_13375, partial [Candidatus Limnocylindrales bacterium]|nr:hypothetical protein [Candidatus Limnocylindrales bacterium]